MNDEYLSVVEVDDFDFYIIYVRANKVDFKKYYKVSFSHFDDSYLGVYIHEDDIPKLEALHNNTPEYDFVVSMEALAN